MNICFYAAVDDPVLFEHVEFYRQDIEILRAMGHTVDLARRPADLRRAHDMVWAWWQTSGMPAIVFARARRIPSVLVTALSERDRSASGMPGKSLAAKSAGRVALRVATVVLAVSEDTREGLLHYRTSETLTAPLSVDTERYAPHGGPKGDYVLCISHLTQDNVSRKKVLDVVRAIASIPGLQGKIVGRHGAGAPRVQTEIDRLGAGDRIELVGAVSPGEKRELLQHAMLYVQPTEYEAFGMAIAEAMSCGTPVLSHRVGNVPSLVGDTGWLLSPETGADGLAAALSAALEDPVRAEQGRRARIRIQEGFSLGKRRTLIADTLASLRASP